MNDLDKSVRSRLVDNRSLDSSSIRSNSQDMNRTEQRTSLSYYCAYVYQYTCVYLTFYFYA
jgi:hypothetical protein